MSLRVESEETVRTRSGSVPVIEFTDAEAGAREFPSCTSRSFNYFKPKGKKATVYEDVTVDVQPDPERYLLQGWVLGFADGEGGFPKGWTAARATDWHSFRDPNEEWGLTISRNNGQIERAIAQNVADARTSGAFGWWASEWATVVERHVGAWMHAEHGLGMHVFLPAQRDAPTNMINNAIAVNAMHKLRFAQDLVLCNLQIDEARDAFDGQVHIRSWSDDPVWQPVRQTVEGLTAIRDWCEALFVANLVFEPLVGSLFRRGYVMATAAKHGDFVTPNIMGVAESDLRRDVRYTMELISLLTRDEEHGAQNIETFQGWLSDWIQPSLRAAQSLEAIWLQPATPPVPFEHALADACDRVRDTLRELMIPIPGDVDDALEARPPLRPSTGGTRTTVAKDGLDVIEFELDGEWTAANLSGLLSAVTRIYDAVLTAYVAAPTAASGESQTTPHERRSPTPVHPVNRITAGSPLGQPQEFSVVRVVRANLKILAPEAELRVRRIAMASPGVLSLEGSGEPIKETGKLIERLTLLNQKRVEAGLANESMRLDLAKKRREDARDEQLDEIAIARDRIHLVEEVLRLRFGDDFRAVPGVGELVQEVLSGAKDIGDLLGSVRPQLSTASDALP